MIDVFPFADFPVAVFGLDPEGLIAAEALAHAGAEVWAWDDDAQARARAEGAEIPLVDLYGCDWKQTTTLVVGGAVPFDGPRTHEIVTKARAAGCEVIGDVELLVRTQRGFVLHRGHRHLWQVDGDGAHRPRHADVGQRGGSRRMPRRARARPPSPEQ